ncbi:MAG: hypothetical protein GC164_12980 [Phycisphaera sp.]|nr:hypothetical protein [Phycisphaera sp.]
MPTPTAPVDPPTLTQPQLQALREAVVRSRKVAKAAGVASFNAWSTAIFAGIALPWGVLSLLLGSDASSWATNLLVGLGLTYIAWTEFQGRKKILALDPEGLRQLGYNQLVFMGLIIVYCLWQLYQVTFTRSELSQQLAQDPAASQLISPESIDAMYKLVGYLVYLTLIPLTLVFQGGCAWYYFARIKPMREHLETTPEWATRLQRLIVG